MSYFQSDSTEITSSFNISNLSEKSARTIVMNANPMTEVVDLEKIDNQSLTLQILDEYFAAACQDNFLRELVQLFTQPKPVLMFVGRYQLLIHPKMNLAMAKDLEHILDYFSIIKRASTFHSVFRFELLSDELFQTEFNNQRNLKSHQYSLETVLWQIYSIIIPERFDTQSHSLSLKILRMPNLAGVQQVPGYVNAVLASCMLHDKTLHQLTMSFEEVEKQDLDKLLLLSILTQMADLTVLENSIKSQQDNVLVDKMDNLDEFEDTTESIDKTLNQKSEKIERDNLFGRVQDKNDSKTKRTTEVTRAEKTGFFSRLLKKLAW